MRCVRMDGQGRIFFQYEEHFTGLRHRATIRTSCEENPSDRTFSLQVVFFDYSFSGGAGGAAGLRSGGVPCAWRDVLICGDIRHAPIGKLLSPCSGAPQIQPGKQFFLHDQLFVG